MTIKQKIYEIIFEAETKAGRFFDILLLVFIVLSVSAVILESVESLSQSWHNIFVMLEWSFTVFFTLEYILRLYCVRKPLSYVFSFYGLIDLLAIIPGYLSFFITGGGSLLVIRGFRLLRVFRLFKLGRYVGEGDVLLTAIKSSRYKITVFVMVVVTLAITVGSLMYLIEGKENGFSSIPRGIYWAIVTMTTVGYGDIAPHTTLGQVLASIVMIMGYGIIAVPTGIISAEIVGVSSSAEEKRRKKKYYNTEVCPSCMLEGHSPDAVFCRVCGNEI